MYNIKCNKGFSLVELAVVLVVMGLLVAGAMAGRELIKSGEIKAAISEAKSYKIAIDNFSAQYEGFPGDLKNATSFWTSGTANGNGDGRIGSGSVSDDTEPYYAWDQLSLSKLIAGTYSGSGTAAVVGTNVPFSNSITASGYSVSYFSAPFSYVDALSRNFPGNYIVLGKNHSTDNYLSSAAISPENAFLIDSKLDDGTPDFGKVLGGTGNSASGTCVTGAAPDIEYNFTNSGLSCTVFFSL